MHVRPLVLGLILATPLAAQEPPRAVQVAEPPQGLMLDGQDRAISRTKQFRIIGGLAADRANAALMAEEAKDELLSLTAEKDAWKVPVTIVLHGKFGDPLPLRTVAMKILFSEIGYELRMDVHLSRGIEPERFKYAAVSALIYERTLRELPARESETPFLVAPWLSDGLREATAWQQGLSDRRLYAALFKTGGLFRIDDLFSLDEAGFQDMDAAMRAAFRVSSGALVMALLQQPQGKEGFRKFLGEVAAFQGETPTLLRKHFPGLNLSETSLAKWWALQLANIGGQNLATDILTVTRTEAALVEALRLNFRDAEDVTHQKEIEAWPELATLPGAERVKSVQLAEDALVRLSFRCFPSYRPIIAEYQIALGAIAKNRTKDLATNLTALAERRATMVAKAQRARDYLDWFEITRARETSGAFDDYMRLKDRLKSNPHRRQDDLSKYLDRMDAIFSRKGDPKPPALSSPQLEQLPLPE